MPKGTFIPSRRHSLSRGRSNAASVPPEWSSLQKRFSMKNRNQRKMRFVTGSPATCVDARATFRSYRPSKQPADNEKQSPNEKHQMINRLVINHSDLSPV